MQVGCLHPVLDAGGAFAADPKACLSIKGKRSLSAPTCGRAVVVALSDRDRRR